MYYNELCWFCLTKQPINHKYNTGKDISVALKVKSVRTPTVSLFLRGSHLAPQDTTAMDKDWDVPTALTTVGAHCSLSKGWLFRLTIGIILPVTLSRANLSPKLSSDWFFICVELCCMVYILLDIGLSKYHQPEMMENVVTQNEMYMRSTWHSDIVFIDLTYLSFAWCRPILFH